MREHGQTVKRGGQPRTRALTGKCRRRALNTSLGGGEAAAPSPACTCPLRAAGTGRLRLRRRRRRRCCCSLLAGCCFCRLCCSGALRGAPCGISAPRGSSRALRPPGWRGGCGAAAAVQEALGWCGKLAHCCPAAVQASAECWCPAHSGGSMRDRNKSWGRLSGRGAGLREARGQRSGAAARGCSAKASRPLRPGARRLMSPPPRLSGSAHRRLPPLAAAGAFSTRGRRGGGGPGAGPGPSRHNEDAGLGAPPSGRGRTGAQLAWVRRAHIKGGPACSPACRGLSTAASSFSWWLRVGGEVLTLGDGTRSSEGQNLRGWSG